MKQVVMVGALIVAGTMAVAAQAPKARSAAEGHTVPKTQPPTAPSPAAPAGEIALGSVHFAKGVKADGKALAAGTYQVRLTAEEAAPAAAGIKMERWVEFVQGGKVAGREVASIIPAEEVKDTQPGPDLPGKQPKAGTATHQHSLHDLRDRRTLCAL